MKFAKELEQECVPEWRAKYIDYKAGKKHVKAVARAIARASSNPRDSHRNTFSPRAPRRSLPGQAQRPDHHSEDVDPLREEPGNNFENEHIGRPIPASSRRENVSESPDSQYGSFVRTPPYEPGGKEIELPGPALDPSGEPARRPSLRRNSLPERWRPKDTADRELPSSSDAHTVTDGSHSSVRNLVNPESPARRANTFDSRPGAPQEMPTPFLRRLMSHSGTIPSIAQAEGDNIPAMDHVRAKEKEFFRFMDEQLEKVETFYKGNEDEAGQRLNVLKDQLHEMRNRRIHEITQSRQHSESNKPHHRFPLRHNASTSSAQSGPSKPQDESKPDTRTHPWQKPVEKALGTFKLGPRLGANSNHLMDMQSPNLAAAESLRETHRMDPARDYVRMQRAQEVPYRSAKRKLKLALKEYYRGLELLKSYALLNRTGFRKINKKYDKAVNAHPPLRYMSEHVNEAWFVRSDVLDQYISAVEDLYARYFERGNHKVAVGKLRSSTTTPSNYSANTFRTGLLIGVGAVFGIEGVIHGREIMLQHPDAETKTNTSYLLQIYGGYLVALYLFAFFCVDCAIWTANKINYVFIFEFDARNHLDWRQLSEFPAFLTMLLGLFVWVNFSGLGTPAMYLYYPVILIFVTVVIIFFPAPILFHKSRSWFVYSHWRLLLAGLYPVEFRDFFLGDMFCSLTYFTSNIELFFCLYARHWRDPPQCNSQHSRLLGFFTTLPFVWRALQCLRRYKDTRSAFPHLANCGKYIASIMYYLTLSLYRIDDDKQLRGLFIFFATVAAVYSGFWDVIMDWSLLQSRPEYYPKKKGQHAWPGLRAVLSLPSPYYYYAAIVLDVILRFNWVFYVAFTHSTQHSSIASFLISVSEITRRGMWTIFRVENEHAANVSRFKASRDVPLPYALGVGGAASTVSGSLVQPEAAEEEAQDEAQAAQEAAPGRVEEGMPPKRRMTLTRILADAHIQDFVKKRKPGEDPTDEREEEVEGDEDIFGDGEEGPSGEERLQARRSVRRGGGSREGTLTEVDEDEA